MIMNNDKACKKPTIKENIIVEGRDDTMAINRAVCAMTIETHGFGISNKTWNLIDRAYKANGIIIFTDPDFAGESIRKRILERYPDASQAFLTEKEAFLKGDIGIENASPEDIIEALKKVKSNGKDNNGKDKNPDLNTENHLKWTNRDIIELGLVGRPDSRQKRELIARELGIGYTNGRGLLKRLNGFGIEKVEVLKALEKF